MPAIDVIDCTVHVDTIAVGRSSRHALGGEGGGRPRLISDHRAKTLDRGVQAVLEVNERALGPELSPQFVTRDQLPRPHQQQTQNLKRLLLQPHACLAASQLAR